MTDERSGPATVTLRPATQPARRAVAALAVRADQRHLVAANADALAEAAADPRARAWTVLAGEVPVGLAVLRAEPDTGEVHLRSLMIDATHQGCGYGRAALERIAGRLGARAGVRVLVTACVPGEGGPLGFYTALGFERDGTLADGELVLRLPLGPVGAGGKGVTRRRASTGHPARADRRTE